VLDVTPEKVATPPQQDKADPELQRMLGEMARQTPGSPKEENPPAGDGDVRKAFLETLQAMGKMLLPLAAMTLLALYLMKLWRRVEPRFCPEERLPVSAYRATLDALADIGLQRKYGASREQFAELVAGRAPEFQELTQLHLKNSLGAGAAPRSRAAWLELTRTVSRKAAAGVPWWRRAAGALHPFSWWKVS
jgi:hypothetical protein